MVSGHQDGRVFYFIVYNILKSSSLSFFVFFFLAVNKLVAFGKILSKEIKHVSYLLEEVITVGGTAPCICCKRNSMSTGTPSRELMGQGRMVMNDENLRCFRPSAHGCAMAVLASWSLHTSGEDRL